MRIVSGKYGGRKIRAKIPRNVRPTSDVLKEAIFNVLANFLSFEGKIAADLCAGTGALGFEALSRGGSFVYFFEKSKKTAFLIREIAESLKIPESDFKIIGGDALKGAEKLARDERVETPEIFFFDPPYNSNLYERFFRFLDENSEVLSGSYFLVERLSASVSHYPSAAKILFSKNYGDSAIDLVRIEKQQTQTPITL